MPIGWRGLRWFWFRLGRSHVRDPAAREVGVRVAERRQQPGRGYQQARCRPSTRRWTPLPRQARRHPARPRSIVPPARPWLQRSPGAQLGGRRAHPRHQGTYAGETTRARMTRPLPQAMTNS